MTLKKILVINCGSSSVKFAIFDAHHREIASALAERLCSDDPQLVLKHGDERKTLHMTTGDHADAISTFVDSASSIGLIDEGLVGVGHRVVHGGESFGSSVLIDDDVLRKIIACNPLAPLHNPANVLGIEISRKRFSTLPQVAVFDTAFHQTLPPKAFVYGLPYRLYQNHGIRRYGFHGTSHKYVSEEAVKRLSLPTDSACILTAHLGNGCSAAAVKNGESVDTTMGLTPLEGLLMGTRCGDLDPSIHKFLSDQLNLDIAEISDILNKQSGLLGISELSNDMRTLCEAADAGHKQAKLAIDVFCYRLAKTISAQAIALGKIDALVFTGGIGENAAIIRANTLEQLAILGFQADDTRNAAHGKSTNGIITKEGATKALVIPTQEEWMIASDTLSLIDNA